MRWDIEFFMSIEITNSEQAELPACPFCGSHGQLIDLHEKSKRLGIEFSTCEPMYSVICCGYYLPISDEKQLAALVQFLMRKNNSAAEETLESSDKCRHGTYTPGP